tara:strand:- start:26558 stop:27619 length:1062 start_codon:yes stop_codon:yes gene_type:complete
MITVSHRHTQRGFSLVELMISMLLGVMLMAGAASVYLSSKRSFVEVEQVAAITENARFAEQIVADSLRHVGFFGEVTAGRVDLAANLTTPAGDCTGAGALAGAAQAYNLDFPVFAARATGANVIGCIDDAVPGSDVLVIKHAVPQAYTDGPRGAADPNDPTHNDGVIDSPTGLLGTRTYVMTNNIRGLVFDGADPAPTIVTGGDIPDGVAWEYQFDVYYVSRDCAECVPYLSRKFLGWDGGGMAVLGEQVAEGVERLRLRFGFDSDDDGEVDLYRDPANLTTADEWASVVSVEIFMLLRSSTRDEQFTDTKTYDLPGDVNPYDPAGDDEKFRRLLSQTSLSLRNIQLIIRGDA